MNKTLLTVRDLVIATATDKLVENVNFDVREGAATGLVGESGSGKSMTLRAIMGLLPEGVKVTSGMLTYRGKQYDMRDTKQLEVLRGQHITMIFQEPGAALNPLLKVGKQVIDAAAAHTKMSVGEKRQLVYRLLDSVGMHDVERTADSYPFELSGGMKQRVVIAAAMALEPHVILCDEPTTALDVTIQAQILSLLGKLMEQSQLGLLYVSHDLAVVSQLCADINVMHGGNIVESGTRSEVFRHPADDYTKQLIAATPTMRGEYSAFRTEQEPEIASLKQVTVSFADNEVHLFKRHDRKTTVLDAVDLSIHRGEILGLVGESGSGKSTIARVLCGLQPVERGDIRFQGRAMDKRRNTDEITGIQMVFQDPDASLDPTKTIRQTLSELVKVHRIVPRAQTEDYCAHIMEQCQLDRNLLVRKPGQLSGGQKQRVAIGRALVLRPELLIADEPTSALDVSVQSEILALLQRLQRDLHLSILFISHDLAVVRNLCSHVAVIHHGVIVENGTAAAIFEHPVDAYTKQLLSAIPQMKA